MHNTSDLLLISSSQICHSIESQYGGQAKKKNTQKKKVLIKIPHLSHNYS